MKRTFFKAAAAILILLTSGLSASPVLAVEPVCTITIADSYTTIQGTNLGDVICITGDNNTVNALGGDDTVVDDGINNTINLGEGFDIYDGTGGDGSTVDGGAGGDSITGTPGEDELYGGDGDDTLIGGEEDDNLNGGLGADELSGNAGDDTISGEAEPDSIDGGDGADTLNGGDGDDTLIGGIGNDTMNGGFGADDLAGNAGDDTIYGEAGPDDIDGGDGTDRINGGDADDTLVGGVGNDTMNGGLGADQLQGDAGADNIYGEAGSDTLSGGDGNDVLAGGDDIDTISGGAGLNICDYNSGEVLTSTCKYDDLPPVLVSWSLSESVLDVGSSGDSMEVTIRLTDESGVEDNDVWCSNQTLWPERLERTDNSSGSSTDVTLRFRISYEMGLQPFSGSCTIGATDKIGNQKYISFGSFEVKRSGTGFDDLPPVLVSWSLSESVLDVGSSGDSMEVTIRLTDESGVEDNDVWCSNQTLWPERLERTDNSSGSSTDVTLRFRISYEMGLQPFSGSCTIGATDKIGNQKYISFGSFEVKRSGTGFDDLPPVLVSWSLSESVLDVGSSGDSMEVTIRLTDESGVEDNDVWCSNQTLWPERLERTDNSSGSSTDVTLRFRISYEMGLQPFSGSCTIGATDKIGNQKYISFGSFRVFRTPAGQPTAPLDFDYTPLKPTTGKLSWSTPITLGDPALYAYVTEYSSDGTAWKVLPKSGTKAASLDVSGLKADTDYWFRVRGENGGTVGQDITFMNLNWATIKIHTPAPVVSDAPTNLVVSNVTSSGYKLLWTTPAYNGGSAIVDFKVETSSDGGKTWKLARPAGSTSLSVTASGAAPGTTYQVRISAVNSVGASEYLTGSVKTDATAPTAPRTLTSTDVAPKSLTLSWQLPSSNGGLAITDYKVEVSSNDGTSWTVINDGVSTNLAADISNLLKNRSYKFRVTAINSIGAGAVSDVHTVSTLSTTASAPLDLVMKDITSNSVVVNWSAPSDFGGVSLTDYKIETSRDGVTWTVVPKSISVNRSLKLTGLAPGTTYQVRISAVNSVGASEYLTGSVKTDATAPTAPRTLTSTDVAPKSLTLSWQLPSSNGGLAITDYKVEVSSNDGTSWTVINDGVSTNLAADISNLLKNRSYKFRVTAINSIGAGAVSDVHTVSTLSTTASAPLDLVMKDITSNSVVVNWSAPSDFGGVSLTDYKIETSRDGVTWTVVPKSISVNRSLKLTGLAPGTTYQVRISAFNSVGASDYLTGTFTTTATVASQPRNLSAGSATTIGLTLSWQLPSSNGGSAITDYRVEVSSNCSTYTTINRLASNNLGFKVSGLKAGTKYCFRVSAVNAIGTSQASAVVSAVTAGNAPTAPTSLSVKASKTSVVLGWKASTVTNGSAVRNYIVEYSKNNGGTWTKVTKSVSTSTKLTVSGLKTKTNYLFRVTATNDVGNSAASKSLKVTTP